MTISIPVILGIQVSMWHAFKIDTLKKMRTRKF